MRRTEPDAADRGDDVEFAGSAVSVGSDGAVDLFAGVLAPEEKLMLHPVSASTATASVATSTRGAFMWSSVLWVRSVTNRNGDQVERPEPAARVVDRCGHRTSRTTAECGRRASRGSVPCSSSCASEITTCIPTRRISDDTPRKLLDW